LTDSCLDGASAIGEAHLRAALAIWDYCERSAKYLFGDRLGDPVGDEILTALERSPSGLTRTDIRDLLGRHAKADRVAQVLVGLLESGRARCETEHPGGRGRPIERWHAAQSVPENVRHNATKIPSGELCRIMSQTLGSENDEMPESVRDRLPSPDPLLDPVGNIPQTAEGEEF
jgi:hypothetical protein